MSVAFVVATLNFFFSVHSYFTATSCGDYILSPVALFSSLQ